MATACNEDLPLSPTDTKSVTESINSSGSKSVSRSPSNSSIKEDRWPALVVSKEPKYGVRKVIKCKPHRCLQCCLLKFFISLHALNVSCKLFWYILYFSDMSI